ncbi:MAG: AAA family ATPase [Candidatus Omnitrophica bacterium]|nr:AAA family ATPase [Candidatus Omnitrophota bacterium]
MTKMKFFIWLRLNWLKLLLIVLAVAFLATVVIMLTIGFSSFAQMESFSRKQMTAQMGMYLFMGIVQGVIFVGLYALLYYSMFMGGGLLGATNFEMPKIDVKFDEVIGLEEAKKDAAELIKLLKDRKLLKQVGGRIIKGTMMMGPPGCGKTYLAKAIANECGLPMIASTGSDFVGIFVGQGTARIKSLFSQARQLAQIHGGCIIFIDEIDSFARPRGVDMGGGGRMDMNSTINQFLTEMDGLRNSENSVVVIAATNVAEYELDTAIMRAGRFDRKINVTRPNLKEREQIFKLYLSKVSYDSTLDTTILARKTVWFTPAEIANMVREASLIGMRNHREKITKEDMNESYERVSFGQKSNIVMSEKERYATAYHETGHAIIAYLFHPTDDVLKATVVPRRGSLGYVFHRPKEEYHSQDKNALLADIKISLASYVVEKKKFDTTTTGVGGGPGSDFAQAMAKAQKMVWCYGMGRSGLIGDFEAMEHTTGYFSSISPISEGTKQKLNDDTQDILQTCLKEVQGAIDQHWEAVTYFAEELNKRGDLEADDIETIFSGKFNLKPLTRA